MRGRFHPLDQQLYVSGMRSWVSRATQDGCFQRIRYTGQPVYLPNRVQTYANGLAITFHQPLDQAAVEHPDAYRIRRWNYQWSNQYGSLHYRLPPRRVPESAVAGGQTPAETAQQPPDDSLGEDEVEILSARLLDDAKTVFLEIADMRPANQWSIDLGIRAADKTPIRQQVYYTVHRVPAQRMEVPSNSAHRPGRSIRRDDPRLSPGLLVRPLGTDDSGRQGQIRVHRLATWPQDRGNRLAVEGFIDVPAPGRYRFRIQSEGHARLMVQGTSVVNGQEIDLNAGLNSLEMLYEPAIPPAPATAAANQQGDLPAFRVLWQSDLFARLQCQNCHGEQPRAIDSTWQAPDLVATSSRFNATWLATWLVGPSSLHPDARMPDVVHGEGE